MRLLGFLLGLVLFTIFIIAAALYSERYLQMDRVDAVRETPTV